jgi:hypothetical protein
MIALALSAGAAAAQGERDRNGDRDRGVIRIEPGVTIPIRTNEAIDVRRTDEYRVFTGVVVRDVRGADGRLAIPRGSTAELMVKASRPGEAVLDIESITLNGQRYAVRTDSQAVGTAGPPRPDIIGSIVGAIAGGEARGREVRVPSGTPVNFRLERPLDVGVADAGVNRDGHHYHDYYGRGRGGQ